MKIDMKEKQNKRGATKVAPITPAQAMDVRIETFDENMIRAVNNLIQLNLKVTSSYVESRAKQKEIFAEYCKITGFENTTALHQQLLDRHVFDFEDLYRDKGWKVEYHKPDYTESHYDAYFVFSMKLKN
jgi:hypothetical protein